MPKKDGIQLLPIGEVAAKDEFWNTKKVTIEDQLAAHRVPPQPMGIIPSNAGGFGDVEKAARVFNGLEIEPLKARLGAVLVRGGIGRLCRTAVPHALGR